MKRSAAEPVTKRARRSKPAIIESDIDEPPVVVEPKTTDEKVSVSNV